jgi:hypothetical protein
MFMPAMIQWIARFALCLAMTGATAPAIARMVASGGASEQFIAQICGAAGLRHTETGRETPRSGGSRGETICAFCVLHSGDVAPPPALASFQVTLVEQSIALVSKAAPTRAIASNLRPLSRAPPDSD